MTSSIESGVGNGNCGAAAGRGEAWAAESEVDGPKMDNIRSDSRPLSDVGVRESLFRMLLEEGSALREGRGLVDVALRWLKA